MPYLDTYVNYKNFIHYLKQNFVIDIINNRFYRKKEIYSNVFHLIMNINSQFFEQKTLKAIKIPNFLKIGQIKFRNFLFIKQYALLLSQDIFKCILALTFSIFGTQKLEFNSKYILSSPSTLLQIYLKIQQVLFHIYQKGPDWVKSGDCDGKLSKSISFKEE